MVCPKLNEAPPTTMHADLNSCFATAEKEAHYTLRDKEVLVAAYTTPNGCVVSPCVKAKAKGVKTAMRVCDAKAICPKAVVVPPDPPKYRYIHGCIKEIAHSLSPEVTPLSIDEVVINLNGTPAWKNKSPYEIGEYFQSDLSKVGSALTCSSGFGPNRFLAKTAAGLKKPNGINIITHSNLVEVYSKLKLTDLCGIAGKNQARLNSAGIFTPLEFLAAPVEVLTKQVFESIDGYYWHERLRGFEVDGADHVRGSFGNSYSLKKPTADKKWLCKYIMKLTEKAVYRMRRAGYSAQGVSLSLAYGRSGGWHKDKTFPATIGSVPEVYRKALYIYELQQVRDIVTNVCVSCFGLVENSSGDQLSLFDDESEKLKRLAEAKDVINEKYGQYTIYQAIIQDIGLEIIDRISFGTVNEMINEVYDPVAKAPELLTVY
jgi:DNA polymerase-4